MEDTIKEILKEIKGEYFEYEVDLISDGWISSFDLLCLIQKIEEVFFIKIPINEIKLESFNSIALMEKLIYKYIKRF